MANMKKGPKKLDTNDQATMIRYLLVIELWRAGLPQAQISKRLSLSPNMVNAMLKGLKRAGTQSATD